MAFAYASGDQFLANMKFLIDFVNVLPTLTRSFSNRYGLPAHLQLRWFHPDDANRYFLFLRDSNVRALRNIFSGAKFIGTAPIYTNEKVAWKFMNYPGPWLIDPARPEADRALSTSFDMAEETDENVATLRRRVVAHDALREGLQAARVLGGSDRLVLETDVLVVGSGAGGSFVAAELAAKTDQRILIVDKGDFIEPSEFLQRERLMMPRILDTEFSVVEVFGRTIPTVSTAVATGKLVGGSATINHALAFEPPAAGDPGLAGAPRRPVRLRRPHAPPGGDPHAAPHRAACRSRRSRAATSRYAGASRSSACCITARPYATRISASAVATVIWAVATTASSRR